MLHRHKHDVRNSKLRVGTLSKTGVKKKRKRKGKKSKER